MVEICKISILIFLGVSFGSVVGVVCLAVWLNIV